MPAADTSVVAVADQLFAAIVRGDEPTLAQMFDDDIAVWRVGSRRDDDKTRALRVLHWFIDVTAQRSYEVHDRQVFPDGFVQQHILHATGRNGGLIALRVCIVIKVGRNDLITRIDEYFDPGELAPLMS
jgi:ketosteroid isomerase-like protein